MKPNTSCSRSIIARAAVWRLVALLIVTCSADAYAAPPEPLVAVHVSELTQALETMPAKPPTPSDSESTGYEWFYTSWHYFVAHQSLKEALGSDGTPFVVVTDADIAAGSLLHPDGSPRYPILISLASEAISDAEIVPLRDYVAAGGFLFVGSSAFTRFPNGATRGNFALANEMGLHMVEPSLLNWNTNRHFTKIGDHQLVSNIPGGTLNWRMPLTSEEIPLGVSPSRVIHWEHFVWQVRAGDATVVAQGSSTPLLATKKYGQGTFIYHAPLQPLVGHGGFDPGMYAYLIYRNAIEWAFRSAGLPIIKLSPWRYQHDAAFIVRHDFENFADMIRSIEASASFEHSAGASGDYYFCTGTLREEMPDRDTVVTALRSAVSNFGATIGSHNGGLRNPVNLSLSRSDYDYWHWGPDEALDESPPGYPSGRAYADTSISLSVQDIEAWLAGTDNGRSGCGARADCPRIWVAPAFNGTREASYSILENLQVVGAGEQKIGPFPHWTLSTQTAGKRYPHLTLPVSDWYVGTDVVQTLDDHSSSSMRAAVDFYHELGALVNVYGHNASQSGNLQGAYVTYSASKPNIWSTNTVGVYDWWRSRSAVTITPSHERFVNTAVARASMSGATDPDTAVEIVVPNWNPGNPGNIEVLFDGLAASPSEYRVTKTGVKVRTGAAVTSVEVRYPLVGVSLSVLSLTPTSVTGGANAEGTVTLSGPAPTGGAVVTLGDDSPAVTVPASVTVAAGATGATFTVTTEPVSTPTSATITALYGGVTQTAILAVQPAATLSTLSVTPTSVTGGASAQGTVTLNGPAPTGGAVVTLTDNSSAVTVPASVTVVAGATSATFTATTVGVTASTTATITASYSGVTRTATLTVMPAARLSTLSLAPTSVTGGTSAQGTVTLNAPAPSGGARVTLSDNSSYVSVPASVTVAAGATSATFTVTTVKVSRSRSATITASYGGVTRSASLTITPGATLSTLSVTPTSVTGGASAQGTVTLNGPAPTGGAVVTLTDNSSAVSVPGSVTVAAGSTSATFTVTTVVVMASTAATITATYNGVARSATLTVTPAATLSTLSVTPTSVTGGASAQGTVTLNGPAPTGGAVVTLTDDSSAVSVPGSVTVAAGSTSATFTATTVAVAASTTATITATYNGVARSATLTVTAPVGTTYPLSVTKTGTGSGTVTSSPSGIECGPTCSASFASGTAVTLTATPAGGSTFSGWSAPCAGTGTCSVTMNAAASVTASFALALPETGLMAAYGFNEGTGTTVADASGNGHTGTVTATAWTASGKYGNALTFNGTSSWVTVGDSALLDLTTGMTLEAWIYPTTSPANWRSVLLKEQPGAYTYALYTGPTNRPSVVVVIGGTEQYVEAPTALSLNTWTHVAGTYDGTTLRLYVNGTQVGSKAVTGSIATSASVLRFGGNSIWGEYFTGRLDQVRIYNRALSLADIQTNMISPLP